ncbi:MAG: YfhO family protein [Candidatus Melainabacteria bacterium]|nr:YfhO family protein [Candidatus Melainabacteria bacterium]
MHNGSTVSKKTGQPYLYDLICLVCLTIFVVAVFFSTIFSGQDISRIGTVAHRDTLFGRLAKGSADAMDTCIYQEHAPNYLLTEKIIAGGNLPLWNPYLGLGCPLWADSQVLAFSPITWLQAPFASLRLYNLLMVFHIWIGCVGAYIFTRLLKISPLGSLLSSISYAFCPNLLYMFEWNRCQSAFFPMPFLGFALLWRREDAGSTVACAILCTAIVVSGHVIPTFFAIALASCMYFALVCLLPQNQPGKSIKTALPGALKTFVYTGLLTILLSAPFVVPFLDTLRASDTFKSSQGYVRYIVHASALLPSLFFPFHGAGSLYPGAVSIVLAVSAFLISKKNRVFVGIFSVLALLTICILTRPGPFDLLFQLPYLSWFMVVYALPALILFIAVLAGSGFDALLDEDTKLRSALVIAVAAVISISMPFLFNTMHLSGVQMHLNDWITTMTVNSPVRVRELVLLVLTVLSVIALFRLTSKMRHVVVICLIAVNVVSLGLIIRKSLPARPAFAYEELAPLGFLKSESGRVLSMGRHVLVPNTSQIFSISNLVSFMPTHPRGVMAYLGALGITIEGVGQYAEKPLTKLVDAASVKYAVASEPVLSTDDKLPVPVHLERGISFGSQVKLLGYALSVDAGNLDVVGKLAWKRGISVDSAMAMSKFLFLPMLVKEDGGLLWIGDRHSLGAKSDTPTFQKETVITAAIPKSLQAGQTVCLILQVVDSSTGQLVEPKDVPAGMQFESVPKSLLLKRFAVPEQGSAPVSSQRHFRLVKETAPEMVRVYENTGCLPQAYLVTKARPVGSIEDAIAEMLKSDFDPRREALIEGEQVLKVGENTASENLIEAKVSRPSVNEVLAEVEASKPSLMVLTDVFFPGWRAEVDGKSAEIYRVNAVFRGVIVEAGRHEVRFIFDPIDLKIGFALFVLGLAAIVFLLRSGKRNVSEPQTNGELSA